MLNMKHLLCLFLISLTILGLSAQTGELDTALLNTAVTHLDQIMTGCLQQLELVAQSPEARTGDWPGIKKYLSLVAEDLPGVYFYVLPDGNYYSIEKDFTNLNLSNRGYFDSLFSGNKVLGYDIYSRSSGRQSALMAAPIIVDGRVTGALGASVFLDELRTRLNSEMDLPDTYTWFVLNQNGLTMLDRELEYIFLNPLELGSESMRNAIGYAMLSPEAGELSYEMGSIQRRAIHKKLPNLYWWFFIASKERITSQAQERLNLSLETIVPALQSSLDSIDNLARSAVELQRRNIMNEANTRELLRSILNSSNLIVQAAFVNPEGIMQAIEPGDYRNFEGSASALRNT
ncbi:MAG: cache domain-containing protein [Candidatus Cloacimonadota bacterium]